MATRKTTTTTRKAPTTTRAPKAPSTPQKAPTGRQRAARDGQAKGNKFDAIARAVATGDDDLARQLQDSITAAKDGKAKAGSTRKGMPSVPDDATGRKVVKVTSTYKGRPTSNVATIAQRAKESGLRVRASMDVADIAQRLRATPDAIAVWLAARDGSKPTAPAKPAKPAAPAKPAKPTAPAKLAVTLRHPWVDREPDYLRGHVLRFTYTVDPNTGHVTSQLHD